MTRTASHDRALIQADRDAREFPPVAMPVQPNDRLHELYRKPHHTPAEAAEWERLTS